MKKVVKGEELQIKIKEAVNLLCDTVKSTLGPVGTNAIIDHSLLSPFITNDGVTIAQNIESEDEVINTILTLAKEASIKTNDYVADGTTTTLVLLQSIYKEGLKYIEEKNYKPILLKNKLNNYLPKVLKLIEKYGTIPTEKQILNIAITSAGNQKIGQLVSEAYFKAPKKEAIYLKEVNEPNCSVVYKKGYTLEYVEATNYYFKEKEEIVLNNCYVLLINNVLENLESIARIINEVIKQNKALFIIADDYDQDLVREVVSLYFQNIPIYLVKMPAYGLDKLTILDDLKLLTNASIVEKEQDAKESDLGVANIIWHKDEFTINFDLNEKIKKKREELEKCENKDELTQKRIAMLSYGIAQIHVGSKLDTDRRELKMHFEDALGAVFASLKGVVLGGGVTLYLVSKLLKGSDPEEIIFAEALKAPLLQILDNAEIDAKPILARLDQNKEQVIYNVLTNKWEKENDTTVIDPLEVVLTSLSNATLIASLLLTTTSLIINEQKPLLGEQNIFKEF